MDSFWMVVIGFGVGFLIAAIIAVVLIGKFVGGITEEIIKALWR